MTVAEASRFRPAPFLAEGRLPDEFVQPDLLILNQPIANFDVFSRLWGHARYRICADGGANRLYDMFQGALEARREDYLPNCIHGDLDSLREDVRRYYASRGVEVSKNPDQQSTDFGKSMQKIASMPSLSCPAQRDIIILGTLGGRVDQGLGLLHEMIREEKKDPMLRLWLLSESSISFVLKKGLNVVEGLKTSRLFTPNMGLVPIFGPATISTSGLEWDVQKWDTEMGTQISTSNHVTADEVRVQTTAPILFTIERSPLPAKNDTEA